VVLEAATNQVDPVRKQRRRQRVTGISVVGDVVEGEASLSDGTRSIIGFASMRSWFTAHRWIDLTRCNTRPAWSPAPASSIRFTAAMISPGLTDATGRLPSDLKM